MMDGTTRTAATLEAALESCTALGDNETVYAMLASVAEAEGLDPLTIKKAKAYDNWSKWDDVIRKELCSLEAARTWDVMECSKNVNVIGCKWVFKIKRNTAGDIDRYKVRLVAKGYS